MYTVYISIFLNIVFFYLAGRVIYDDVKIVVLREVSKCQGVLPKKLSYKLRTYNTRIKKAKYYWKIILGAVQETVLDIKMKKKNQSYIYKDI